MRPLLSSLKDGEVHHFNEAYEDVCKHFDVSDDEKKGRIGSGLWFMISTNLTHHKSKT